MSNKNRPAILGLVEKAWGSVGQEAAVESQIQSGRGSGQAETRSSSDKGYSTKSPGREIGGGRKGPRKPAPRPPRRP